MGEVPLIVMQNIHVVNGKAGFASQYMIARANSSGVLKGRIDWRIDRSDPNNLAVTAFAILKETGGEVSVTCDMKMAKAEQWVKNPKYTSMPEVMLRYRSAAFLVRFYAPDVMLGYQTTEEIEDVGAAALPSQPPLNAKMLIEQSQPAVETVNQETGEITDQENPPEAFGTVRETPGAEESTSATSVDDGASSTGPALTEEEPAQAQPEEHPGKAVADKIIAEINDPATNAVMDVAGILTRSALDMQAMLDEDAVRVEIAADRRRNEIRAQQAKAKEVAE
jgi:hypothetical protein